MSNLHFSLLCSLNIWILAEEDDIPDHVKADIMKLVDGGGRLRIQLPGGSHVQIRLPDLAALVRAVHQPGTNTVSEDLPQPVTASSPTADLALAPAGVSFEDSDVDTGMDANDHITREVIHIRKDVHDLADAVSQAVPNDHLETHYVAVFAKLAGSRGGDKTTLALRDLDKVAKKKLPLPDFIKYGVAHLINNVLNSIVFDCFFPGMDGNASDEWVDMYESIKRQGET